MKKREKTPPSFTAGYYGKVPTQGDFVSRGFSRALTDRFDEWLRQCVRESQDRMGRDWLNAFLVAPVWRMALSAGTFGPDPIIGIMMPSVDRAGRYFPLVIAAPLPGVTAPLEKLHGLLPWFDAAEDLARSTLSPHFALAVFDQQLARLELPVTYLATAEEQEDAETLWWTRQDPAATISLDKMPEPSYFDRIFMSRPFKEDAAPPETGEDAPALPPPTRRPLSFDIASANLKAPSRSDSVDRVIVNEEGQAVTLLSALGDQPNQRSAVDHAAETVAAIDSQFSMSDLISNAKGRIGMANTLLYARSLPNRPRYALTAVTLLMQGQMFSVLWAGNARAYLLRGGTLTLLTRDHVDLRLPGIVTRAIGADTRLTVDQNGGDLQEGDRFLLCSGSIADRLHDGEMAETLEQATTPKHVVEALTQDAMIAGARMDVTAAAVFVT
ncbi:type VI secretion system-associated protein TagF [Paracoccaceae bacterium GXU_MW_L88]